MNLNLFIKLVLLSFSVLMILSCSSWFFVWLMFELNLVIFISIMLNNAVMLKLVKYFIFQVLTSISIISSFFFSVSGVSIYLSESMLVIGLMMKLGSSPFHFWMIEILEGGLKLSSILIMTVQKISPIFLLSYCANYMLLIIVLISLMTGAIGGINQNLLMTLMAYSSISHSGWLILGVILSVYCWVVYFLFYLISLMMIMYLFYIIQMYKVSDVYELSKEDKIYLGANLISFGGMPPMMGFMSKVIILNYLLILQMPLTVLLAMLFSSIVLFYYLKIVYSLVMVNSFLKKQSVLFSGISLNLLLLIFMMSNFGILFY